MRYLVLILFLLFYFPNLGKALTIDYISPALSNNVYVLLYYPQGRQPIQQWNLGSGYLTASLTFETTEHPDYWELEVWGRFTEPVYTPVESYDPEWFSDPVEVYYNLPLYPGDLHIDNGYWRTGAPITNSYLKNSLSETVLSHSLAGPISPTIRFALDYKYFLLNGYLFGQYNSLISEGGGEFEFFETPEPSTLSLLVLNGLLIRRFRSALRRPNCR